MVQITLSATGNIWHCMGIIGFSKTADKTDKNKTILFERLKSQGSSFKSLITQKVESFCDLAYRKTVSLSGQSRKTKKDIDNYVSSASHWVHLKKTSNLIKMPPAVLPISHLQVPLSYCQNYSVSPGRCTSLYTFLKINCRLFRE